MYYTCIYIYTHMYMCIYIYIYTYAHYLSYRCLFAGTSMHSTRLFGEPVREAAGPPPFI